MTSTSPELDTDAVALARIAVLRSSHDRLHALVESLTPEQVRERGYPSEWTIAQVLSHLGSGAEINGLVFDAGLSGQDPPKQEQLQAIWDVWNAKTPDAQAADAMRTDTLLMEKIEALDAAQRAGTSFSIWSGRTDITGLVSSRLSEHAVHGWDIEVVIDPTATIPTDATGIILDGVSRLIGFLGQPGPAGRVHVTTTDPAGEYALVLGEKVSLTPWDGGESSGQLTLPAEALLRLIYGRLDSAHTPPLTATGMDLDALRAVFPGF